ncbi:hypothetical protein [Novosphingobium sp. AAP93]|uniref:hypothetical protein n=1 Tax=Novosphingobium sp. AAP93 TaxID=1523427 RepID=UPI0012E12EC5|nr:hypothetical protein [Novosphingobium sp. AAP93]
MAILISVGEAAAQGSVRSAHPAGEFSRNFNACVKRANGIHEALRSCADREADFLSDSLKAYQKRIALNLSPTPRRQFLAAEQLWENGLFNYCQLHDGLGLFRSDSEPGLELVDCYLAEYAKRLIWLRKRFPATFKMRN